ncbi:response regulator transcription factor [Streptomyces griseus]|uniref:response regulator transcription factor n=1 Tax=Streptomyces griseus TaxID=1911 RepID=UPI00340D38FA
MSLSSSLEHGRTASDTCDVPSWARHADLSLLTARERETLAGLGECLTNATMADRWHVTERTVKKHVANVFVKLRISTRAEAAVIATFSKCAERCPQGHWRGPSEI